MNKDRTVKAEYTEGAPLTTKLLNALLANLREWVGDRDWDEMEVYETMQLGDAVSFHIDGPLKVMQRAMKNLKSSHAKKKGITGVKLHKNPDGERADIKVELPYSLVESQGATSLASKENDMSIARIVAELVNRGEEDLANELVEGASEAAVSDAEIDAELDEAVAGENHVPVFNTTVTKKQIMDAIKKVEKGSDNLFARLDPSTMEIDAPKLLRMANYTGLESLWRVSGEIKVNGSVRSIMKNTSQGVVVGTSITVNK